MGIIERLLTRFRHSGVLFLIGFFLIIYIALGFLYLQQGPQQRELEEQSAQLSLVVSKPLPSEEKLRAEYDEVNRSLAPMSVEAALEIIVSIAEGSGIDVDPDSGKLIIPPAAVREEKVGEGTYQVLSFRNISVQGDYASVMAFISALDSGKTLKSMVLKRVTTTQTEVEGEGEEESGIKATAALDVDLYTKPGE